VNGCVGKCLVMRAQKENETDDRLGTSQEVWKNFTSNISPYGDNLTNHKEESSNLNSVGYDILSK
jgi:hypothetical protein